MVLGLQPPPMGGRLGTEDAADCVSQAVVS